MPNNRDCSNHPTVNAAGRPDRRADQELHHGAAQDQRQHAPPRGPDRHPNADLPCASRHRVGGHAGQSEAREQQRDEPERHRQPGDQALEIERASDLLVHRHRRPDGDTSIDVRKRAADVPFEVRHGAGRMNLDRLRVL